MKPIHPRVFCDQRFVSKSLPKAITIGIVTVGTIIVDKARARTEK